MNEFNQNFRKKLKNPLCLSLDLKDRERGIQLLHEVGPNIGMVKAGPIPFLSFGDTLLKEAELLEIPLFLDLKWHDIPHTVHDVIAGLRSSSIRIITIHASGGPSMISAARKACESLGVHRPLLVAVTALTHLTPSELHQMGYQDRWSTVKRLGGIALDSGADGLVLSPGELSSARDLWQESPFLVTPGIRLQDSRISGDDQNFSATAYEAIKNGSDLLVVGRPILLAHEPIQAVRTILADIAKGTSLKGP